MASNYEVLEATDLTPKTIKRTDEDGQVWFIPTDPANSDYQAYLAAQANSTES